jgi:hypothetical protein
MRDHMTKTNQNGTHVTLLVQNILTSASSMSPRARVDPLGVWDFGTPRVWDAGSWVS